MSLDHVSLPVPKSKLEAEISFLNAALAPLGIKELFRIDPSVVALGPNPKSPFLWVTAIDTDRKPILDEGEEEDGRKGTKGRVLHMAFSAKNRKEVDDFHAAALSNGGSDHGKPGVRAHYHPNYYAAFVIDPAGNNIEAVVHHNN